MRICFILCLTSFLVAQEANSFNVLDFKNPFFANPTALSEEFKLEAILSNSVKINGSWYESGDTINSARILKINSDEIVLQRGGELFIIKAQGADHQKILIN